MTPCCGARDSRARRGVPNPSPTGEILMGAARLEQATPSV